LEQERAFETHFDGELAIYSRQLIVNLLDAKGSEERLTKLFSSYLKRVYGENDQIE
jgi:hypothetical protein